MHIVACILDLYIYLKNGIFNKFEYLFYSSLYVNDNKK